MNVVTLTRRLPQSNTILQQASGYLRGVLTRISSSILLYVLLGVIIGFVALYLAATFSIMSKGFTVQELESELGDLSEEIRTTELQLQQKEAFFMEEQEYLLSSLVEISSIRYLEPTSVVISDQLYYP